MLEDIYSNPTIQTIITALPTMLEGSVITLITVIGSLFIGCALGIPMALLYSYGPYYIQSVIALYLWFFRGIPILLLLFLFYFGIFEVLGINFSAIATSCIVLGMVSAAYQTQIIKGALQAIPHGQFAAAQSLGMTTQQTIYTIIFPQAFRLSFPGWINEYSILLKDSALCFVLGTPELMAKTQFIASRTYEHLMLYLIAGSLYFCLTLIGVFFLKYLEHHFCPLTYSIK